MLKIRNRPLRIIAKTLLVAGIAVLVLFTILSIYIEQNKKKILSNFSVQLAEKLNGKISYSNADITVWKTFPYIGLHVSDVRLADSLNIPVLKLEKISFQVSVLQYFRKDIRLNDLSLKNGFVHLFTDTNGYTNKYLFKGKVADSTGQQRKNSFELDNATLRNVHVVMENRQKQKRFDVLFKSLDASMSTSGDEIKVGIDQEAFVNGLGFNLAKGSYLEKQTLEGFTRLRYNKKETLLSFDDDNLKLDGQPYSIKGNFWFRQDSFNLAIKSSDAPFAKLKKIFARNIFSKIEKVNIDKPIDIEAKLQGSLAYKTIPKVEANWKVRNNTIRLPMALISDCNFDGGFTNEITKGLPLTDDNSGVAVTGFSGNWEGVLLKSDRITINNLINPVADIRLRSATALQDLNDKLGLRTVQFLSGKAALDMYYNGPLQSDMSILDKLSCHLVFSGAKIKYLPRDFTFNNCSGDITFSSDVLQAKDLKFDLASNHFTVNVDGSNLSALSSADPGKAVIQCNVSTPALNLGELTSLFASKKQVRAAPGKGSKIMATTNKIDDALDHGQLKIFLNAGSVSFKNFQGRNLRGTVAFYGNDLALNGISIDHAEGNMLLEGNVTQSGNMHSTTAKVKLSNMDVAKVFRAFDNFGQDGISYENLRGKLNASTNVTMAMDNNGSIVPGSMNGTVDFQLKNGALVNFEPVQNIRSFVFKNKDMSNVVFAELKNKLEVSNNKIRIPRMEIQSSALGMFVEGVYDLKKTESKFDIQVPLKGLKKRDSTYVPQNIGIDKKAGTSIYLEGKNDKTGKVKIGLNTTRTIRKLF